MKSFWLRIWLLPVIITMTIECSFSPFSPGKMKSEKRILKWREPLGWPENRALREMGQQVGNYFIAVKKLARGGTANHEFYPDLSKAAVPARKFAAFAPDQSDSNPACLQKWA